MSTLCITPVACSLSLVHALFTAGVKIALQTRFWDLA
jgi:hypothetical protein